MLNGWLLVFKGFYLSVWRVFFLQNWATVCFWMHSECCCQTIGFQTNAVFVFYSQMSFNNLSSKNQNTSKHFISPPQEILNRDISPRSWLGIRDQKMEVGDEEHQRRNGDFCFAIFWKKCEHDPILFYLSCINTVLLMSISHLLTFTFARPRGSTQLFFFWTFFCTFFFFSFCNFCIFLLALESWSMQLFSFLQIFNIAHFQGRQVYQIFVSTNIVSFFTLI